MVSGVSLSGILFDQVEFMYKSITSKDTFSRIWSQGLKKTKASVHQPLGGECGKSRDNISFIRNTPFSYGVPAARLEGLSIRKGNWVSRDGRSRKEDYLDHQYQHILLKSYHHPHQL